MEDITDFLAFEVKKEMADRYFGFRKRIEDDTAAYRERVAISSIELENTIGYALLRIYILLLKQDLITGFITLTGIPKDLFYDPYILDSPTIRKRLFAGTKFRGLTKKKRFLNLVLDTYADLAGAIEQYRRTLDELTEEQEIIREEINLFYRRNDIDSIMGFIRRLDGSDSGMSSILQSGPNAAGANRLSQKMRLHPPLPACDMLPEIPQVPQPAEIKAQLILLAEKAYRSRREFDVRNLHDS